MPTDFQPLHHWIASCKAWLVKRLWQSAGHSYFCLPSRPVDTLVERLSGVGFSGSTATAKRLSNNSAEPTPDTTQKYFRAFEHLPSAVILLDRRHQVEAANEIARPLLKQFAAFPCQPLSLTPASAPVPTLSWLTTVAAQLTQDCEQHEIYQHLPHSSLCMEVQFHRLRDDAGQVIGTLLLCTDITQHRAISTALHHCEQQYQQLLTNIPGILSAQQQVEAALTTSEARLLQFFEEAPFGMAMCEPKDNRFTQANQAFCQMVGYTLEELRSLTPLDITHPDDIEREVALVSEVIQGRRSTLSFEKRYITKQGAVLWVNLRSTVLRDAEGNIREALGIVENVTERKATEEALQISEERFRTVVTNLPGAVYRCLMDQDWTVQFISQGIEALTGYPAQDFVGNERRSFASMLHPDDRDAVEVTIARAIARRQPFYAEYRCLTADGEIRWISDQGQGYWDAEGHLLCLDGVLLDISDRKRAEEHLHILSEACEQSPASIMITDAQGNIEYVNSRFEKVTGYTLDEVKGQNPRLLQSGHTSPDLYRQLWATIRAGQAWYGEFHNRTKAGELFWEKAAISPIKDCQGNITHYIGVKEDITLHKETVEMLAYQTNFDLLTALPNRALAFDRLRQALNQAEKDQEYVALLLVDLDNFKTINETLGHDVGDILLAQAAQRLQHCLCKSDTAARLGGDEFLLLLPGLNTLAGVTDLAHEVLVQLERPYYLGSEECFLSASMGIVTYPTDGDSPGVLLRNAEIALYNAKNTGRNAFKFFELGMNQAAQRRHLITSYLRRALDNQEFRLVYQPFVDLTQGHTVGAEALLRWTNPDIGEISPVEFIPVAEETGLISSIGEWVIQQACQEAGNWPTVQNQPLWVAVNLSPRQFRTPQLLATIIAALQASRVSPTRLELEITERLLLDDLPTTKELMKQFQAMQIRLSIDDFGTGYSALSYLKKFPLNVLKIDRSFVTDLPHDPELMTLVKAIIGMAHELGLRVIAEGIETAEQLALLRAYGCDYGQGHFFSPALRPAEFRAYLMGSGKFECCSPFNRPSLAGQ